MKYYIKSTMYLIPIIMLGFTLASNFYEYSCYQNYSFLDYTLLGNCVGYSLLSDIVFLYVFFYNKSYCWATRLSSIALILINLIDIIGCFIEYNSYNFIFNIAICFVAIVLSIIFEVSKRVNNDA